MIFVSSYNRIIFAKDIPVSSISALQSAIITASSGDVIILANGTYLNNTINVGTSNITIKASSLGSVFLNGTNAITISGNNITFSGFQFTSGTMTGTPITVNGNNNLLTQLNFNGYSADHMIIIYGQNNIVSYSNFQNKPAVNLVLQGGTGDLVQIIPNSTSPGYNTIRYCSFQHMPGFGGDYGNECIRIGNSSYSTEISRTVVEYCYFEDTGLGDSEAISVKSQENCLRYNTMNNNPNAMFCFRNGDNNVAYGNFFIKSGGIRCKQANNIYCYNNYFEQSAVGQNNNIPGSGTRPIYIEYYGAGYGNNFNFIHNTFYECTESEIQNGVTNITWANNIFKQSSGKIFTGTAGGSAFTGNIYNGTLGLTISSGMTNIDPRLVLNSDGYYGLSATSPAIDAASSSYPSILNLTGLNNDSNLLLDIQGQARPSSSLLKDVGCDEYTSGAIKNKPLKITDVGPVYLGGPSLTDVKRESKNFISFELLQNYPNPFNPSTAISYRLPVDSKVSLKIYDVLGRSIKTLLDNEQQAGNYKINFNGTELPSGIYLYRITTDHGYSESKKMMLIK